MPRTTQQLRSDALAIWHSAVDAVRSDRLVKDNVRVDGEWLVIGEETLSLASIGRIAVVGAGKAGAGMATGLEESLGPKVMAEKQVSGWINVPADCVPAVSGTLRVPLLADGTRSVPATYIHLHAARPAGVNEPTAEGVAGVERILEIVSSLGPNDLCLCLISGGGSALMPAPALGVSLAEKQAVSRLLSAGGANIEELNTVRKQLSRIKGGGLARACHAGRLITLIISDVLGDPLDVIASGPTVPNTTTAADALAILERFGCATPSLRKLLHNSPLTTHHSLSHVTNLIIGNNAVAVDAAGMEAERRGYSHAMLAATSLEGAAEAIGVHHAQMAMRMLAESGPDCLITGGEPTVKLAPVDVRGKGGRNQQLVLAALVELLTNGHVAGPSSPSSELSTEYSVPSTDNPEITPNPKSKIQNPKFCLLSGGTDGEDGPTDAAGALIDGDIIERMAKQNLDPADFLRRNDAYSFFDAVGGLIKTGPTHTNVCDVRVVVVDR
jgi:glycerate 2-kinase